MQTNVTRTVVRLMPSPMATTLQSRKVAVTLPFIRGLDDQADEIHPAGLEADPDMFAGRGRYGSAY